ncbi:dimethylarginine dimethylaminohydrolase family protein [Bacillus sp. FJAT-45037]|uniref:dimethylarginine dimethylaminohydrolase family protein n=1 Tax=Bacillus sp. FJAT-45037 TaxID=2011007 RepID=UPI000C251210|nr:dimethylarginine dimethylaminohydrolase family protein [Bacillus sp. FJAT-45037]
MKTNGCQTEYGLLRSVLLCEPLFMKIEEPINETQEHYKEENIDVEVAKSQHKDLVKALKQEGIDVHLLPAREDLPEQVFTRDIGFTIDETIYIGALKREIRQGEEQILKEFLTDNTYKFQEIKEGTIEGGDVMIDENIVYVGDSSRTSLSSIDQLKLAHPNRELELIKFDEAYLHLDCVFNPLSPEVALIYRDAIDREDVRRLESRYQLIDVSEEEQFTLATNVLSIGKGKIIALPQNKETNEKIVQAGFEIIEVDLSEIIKSGGAFRCVTMPIERN